ncbi:hypothetical protein BC831DRAFT_268505 [Entophlyctis helioformis]|nr:hypothetical protein BC831DRAFT_268505 [Entophlyctis helioformis]
MFGPSNAVQTTAATSTVLDPAHTNRPRSPAPNAFVSRTTQTRASPAKAMVAAKTTSPAATVPIHPSASATTNNRICTSNFCRNSNSSNSSSRVCSSRQWFHKMHTLIKR